MQLRNGQFSVEVDIQVGRSRVIWTIWSVFFQDFDPEDIDIKVEGGKLTLSGRREVKHGNSSSVSISFNQSNQLRQKLFSWNWVNQSQVRLINQSFGLPKDIDVSKLSSEVRSCCCCCCCCCRSRWHCRCCSHCSWCIKISMEVISSCFCCCCCVKGLWCLRVLHREAFVL